MLKQFWRWITHADWVYVSVETEFGLTDHWVRVDDDGTLWLYHMYMETRIWEEVFCVDGGLITREALELNEIQKMHEQDAERKLLRKFHISS